jgi:hypothetical protein
LEEERSKRSKEVYRREGGTTVKIRFELAAVGLLGRRKK